MSKRLTLRILDNPSGTGVSIQNNCVISLCYASMAHTNNVKQLNYKTTILFRIQAHKLRMLQARPGLIN